MRLRYEALQCSDSHDLLPLIHQLHLEKVQKYPSRQILKKTDSLMDSCRIKEKIKVLVSTVKVIPAIFTLNGKINHMIKS